MQNGPSSSNSDPHNTHVNYSSDNDDDSETEDEALQKEISRLREKCVTYLLFLISLFLLKPLQMLGHSSVAIFNITGFFFLTDI